MFRLAITNLEVVQGSVLEPQLYKIYDDHLNEKKNKCTVARLDDDPQ